MNMTVERCKCCIVGGGPAGLVLGYLLARAGVSVVVLEKHADFIDDFRGDMIHPATMEMLLELDLLDEFLTLPHQRTSQFKVDIAGRKIELADFFSLSAACPFIAFLPQRSFLAFFAGKARNHDHFKLMMGTEVLGLTYRPDGAVNGVKARRGDIAVNVECELVIGADGRHSKVRKDAGLVPMQTSSPIDVLWMKIPRNDKLPEGSLRFAEAGQIFVMIDRGDYFQCAYLIRKGTAEAVYAQDIEAFRQKLAALVPGLAEAVTALEGWNDVKLLDVQSNGLKHWSRPGLLCIGDAAHAMSPVSGVGINLAIQDAIAAANILTGPLLEGTLTSAHLRKVQNRRKWPTWLTQQMQYHFENGPVKRIMGAESPIGIPLMLRALNRSRVLRRAVASLVGMGLRREKVAVRPGARRTGSLTGS